MTENVLNMTIKHIKIIIYAILKVLKVFMKMYAIIVNYALTQQIVPAIAI